MSLLRTVSPSKCIILTKSSSWHPNFGMQTGRQPCSTLQRSECHAEGTINCELFNVIQSVTKLSLRFSLRSHWTTCGETTRRARPKVVVAATRRKAPGQNEPSGAEVWRPRSHHLQVSATERRKQRRRRIRGLDSISASRATLIPRISTHSYSYAASFTP